MWRSLLKAEGCQSKGEKCSFKLWLINNFAFDLLVHEAVILCMDINTSFSFGLFDSIAVHVKVSSEWIDREGKKHTHTVIKGNSMECKVCSTSLGDCVKSLKVILSSSEFKQTFVRVLKEAKHI